jgi:hypothetical protein
MYGASSNITTDALYTINLETGRGSRIAVTNADLVSLASIPEPTAAVLLGLGSLALLARRRT